MNDQQALLEHYVKKILAAPVYDIAVRTPLQAAPALSEALGNRILLKREDLQPTFSFKIRGAYNKLVQLSDEQKAHGVITASAGNHAQGVALAARELGIAATIVMPSTTPGLKVLGVRSRGAEALLHGESFPFALAHALQMSEQSGRTFVSPFDDPDVIAGQGTVAMEILRQHQGALDAIFIPVGGGGLIAGIAAYVKYLRPEVRIIGVESEHSACLKAALHAGKRVVLPSVGTFADGVAVAQIGEYGFEVCRFCVDEVITVSNDELCAAIKNIYDDTRFDHRAFRRVGGGGDQAIRGEKRSTGSDLRGDRLRRQHQFRQPAPCRRARRCMRLAGVMMVRTAGGAGSCARN